MPPGKSISSSGSPPSGSASPFMDIGLAFLAFVVAFGSEFFVDKGVSALWGEDPTVTRQLLFFTFSLLFKLIVPVLVLSRGESWSKYLGKLTATSWLLALAGITLFCVGFRLLGMESPFPRIVAEFRYMKDLASDSLSVACALTGTQLLYYFAEGLVMVYVVIQASEAISTWFPDVPHWRAGVCGGMLLGLTWGLIHIVSVGSIMAGLFSIILSLPLGFLYGMTRSGWVPWLVWMGFITL